MFLKIKNIANVSWSSDNPLNLKPKLKTFVLLCFGLIIFGFGSSLLIHSTIGNAPWVVLAEGLSNQFNWSIGFATFISSMVVLMIWLPLGEKPGIGTIMNILIIAVVLDLSMYIFDFSSNIFFINLLTAILGVIIVGLGPTGGTLANLLALHGFSILIVEKEKSFYPLPRAVHFDDEIMRVFQTIGITKEFLKHTYMGYYTEPSVRPYFGVSSNQPHPNGYEVPEEEPSFLECLVEPVKKRGICYRKC